MSQTPTNPPAGAGGPTVTEHGHPEDHGAEALESATQRSRTISAQLGAIVAVLMRSPDHRQIPIGDLEGLVGPALAIGQFAIAEGRGNTGIVVPVAAITWALVSEEVDQRLSDLTNDKPRLEPKEWRSGTIPWIITAAGEMKVLNPLLKHLTEKQFANFGPKIRLRSNEGKVMVAQVGNTPLGHPSAPDA
ncbi:MAG: toxin-activating lysine-acyltransferase [Hyphomicrobiaceae bacterium]|nr:toxin-activating lysine-acyltransferase [Hyphomicrobiaceae bacterium]